MPLLELNEWCFVAKSKHHNTSACNIEVVTAHSVCCLMSVVHLLTMLVELLLAVVCSGRAGEVDGKAVEVEGR